MGSTSPQVVNTVTRSLKRKREKKNNKRSLCDNERLKKTEITSFRIKVSFIIILSLPLCNAN